VQIRQSADEPEPKWVPLLSTPFSKQDEFCIDVRRLQRRSKCSDFTCTEIVKIFSNYLGVTPNTFQKADKKIKETAGTSYLRLNGCVGCHQHVYLPDDKSVRCPHLVNNVDVCGHPRYDQSGKPFEVCFKMYMYLPFVNVFTTICHTIYTHTLASVLLSSDSKVKGVACDKKL